MEESLNSIATVIQNKDNWFEAFTKHGGKFLNRELPST